LGIARLARDAIAAVHAGRYAEVRAAVLPRWCWVARPSRGKLNEWPESLAVASVDRV
jgi:hypothetical protein